MKTKPTMTGEDTTTKAVAIAVPKLTDILSPLSPEGRQRAIASAMMIFGETTTLRTPKAEDKNAANTEIPIGESNGISLKGLAWMKKTNLTQEDLDHVFAIDKDSVDVIAAKMPEKTKSKQTTQAYVLCGVASFLRTGEMGFSDTDARALCEKVGCFDKTNHSTNASVKKFGNFISGTRDAGWKITNPGLTEGAALIKTIVSGESEK